MLISLVVPTFCEELSLKAHYAKCIMAVEELRLKYNKNISYEYLVIDNCSHDDTVGVALGLREVDKLVRIFVNQRNYGPVLSPFEGIMQAKGDLVLLIAADLQEPPELILKLFEGIQRGCDASIAYKARSTESPIMWHTRGVYYGILAALGLPVLPYRYSGFGLYSRKLVERLRQDKSEEPSMRILLPKYAESIYAVPYKHQERLAGNSSYSLYGYTREAVKNIARNGASFPNMAGKIAIITAMLSIAMIPFAIAFKLTFWKSLAPGVTTLLTTYLLYNSILMGFIAILLDQQAIIMGKLPRVDKRVKHSEVHE